MLKVKDYEISWSHQHFSDTRHKMDGNPERPEYRAITYCVITAPELSRHLGAAFCSWADNFSRNIGRKISLSRAMQTAELPKKERTLIWEAYRNMGMKEGKTRW